MPDAPNFSDEANVFLKQLMKESDRGAALVGFAYVDTLLTRLFKAKMLPEKLTEELFEGFGPLATMAARIKVAYCLGWIGPETHHDLNLLRKVRNEFAHAHAPVTFSDASVQARCRELSAPKSVYSNWEFQARDQFLITAMVLSLRLEYLRNDSQAPVAGSDPPLIRLRVNPDEWKSA